MENLPRVLPSDARAVIDTHSWPQPAIFDWLKDQGNVSRREMYRTFNCGVGMVVVVPADQSETAVRSLSEAGETVWRIGRIEPGDPHAPDVVLV